MLLTQMYERVESVVMINVATESFDGVQNMVEQIKEINTLLKKIFVNRFC